MGFFDRRNLAGLQTTAKYAPRRKRGGRRPFLLGQDFCSVKNFPTENCLRQRRSSPFLSKNALTILTPKVVLRSKILNEPVPQSGIRRRNTQIPKTQHDKTVVITLKICTEIQEGVPLLIIPIRHDII